MKTNCDCNSAGANTGLSVCISKYGVAVGRIRLPRYNAQGVRNSWALNTVLDAAFFEGLINNADPKSRIYPLIDFDNYTNERADPATETFSSGAVEITTKGLRTIVSEIKGGDAVLLGKLEAWKCTKFDEFLVMDSGTLLAVKETISDVESFRGIGISRGSYNPKLMMATNANIQKVQETMNVEQIENDSCLTEIKVAADVDLLALDGLVDVNIEIVSVGTTDMVVKLTNDYGAGNDPNWVSDLLAADFGTKVIGQAIVPSVLRNTTDSVDVPITGVVYDSVTNEHTISYAAVTVGKELAADIVKVGLDSVATSDAVA